MSDMTNAVAIDLLDNLIGMVDDNQENDYDSALRMAIDALKAQADGDTISRQAAIDYCYALINAENPSDPSDEWNYSQERINQTEVILHHLEFMPSAQPETHEEHTETHSCDLISRQAAINAVYKCADIFAGDMPVMVVKADAYEALAQLPSAQSEMIREIRKWINSGNRGNADYFIVEKIEEIINKYE